MSKSPTDVDEHIGSRVRLRRQGLSLSQEKLAASIGVTFQQLQKYEGGANRISVSRLWQMRAALGVDIAYFFEGLPKGDEEAYGIAPEVPAAASDGGRLVSAFRRIGSAKVRRSLVRFAEQLADED